MKRTEWLSLTLVLMALCMLAGCSGGGTSEVPGGLTQAKKDELSAKYKAEAKKNITKENAEKVAKDLEAQINADLSK